MFISDDGQARSIQVVELVKLLWKVFLKVWVVAVNFKNYNTYQPLMTFSSIMHTV